MGIWKIFHRDSLPAPVWIITGFDIEFALDDTYTAWIPVVDDLGYTYPYIATAAASTSNTINAPVMGLVIPVIARVIDDDR